MNSNTESPGVRSLTLADLVTIARRRPATVLATFAAVLIAAFVWVGTRTPSYRASATLLLEQTRPSGGVLGELASLTSAPRATSEIAILHSRRLADQTVSAPSDGALATPAHREYDERMGLATLVDDLQLLPIMTLLARLQLVELKEGRLFAQAQRAAGAVGDSLVLSFPEPGVLQVGEPGPLPWLAGTERNLERFDLGAGTRFDYRGWSVAVATEGDVLDKRFVLRALPHQEAVKRLLDNTKVIETERNSGVLRLTFEDSDPRRASDVANAITQNYLRMSLGRGEKRASQTVDFVQAQLSEQIAALEVSESTVVELQKQHPESIDVSSSSSAIIDQLSELELERMRMDVAEVALREALAVIQSGDLGALSRLGPELDDPISLSYVEGLTRLSAEGDSQGRSDTGPYKLLLQTRLSDLEAAAARQDLATRALEQLVAALRRGEPNALAQLGASESQAEGHGDPLTRSYLEEIGRLNARIATLSPDLAETNPELRLLRESVSELEGRMLAQLEGRLTAMQRSRHEQSALVREQRELLESYPGEEQGRIASAVQALEARTIDHLRQRLLGLGARRAALDQQTERLEGELRHLPDNERLLAGPLRQLETHKAIVQFLLMSQQEAEITRASTLPSADFIDPAVTPSVRSWPRMGMTLVLAALLGLALGLGLGYLHESLAGGLRTESELELASGLPVVGVIPEYSRNAAKVKFKGPQFLALRDDPDGPVSEAFRSLRASLRFALGEAPIRTLAVTSCVPGEGKSVTNIHLAMTFASAGTRVLLVDADMRRPTLRKYFALEARDGLAEVMQQGASWRELVQQPGHPNLSVLTAGRIRVSAGDLLASDRVGSLIDEFLGEYDMVVFDVPPALVVADIESFSHKLDALLLLYRSEGLPGRAVRSAAMRLQKSGARIAGTILNAVQPRNAEARAYGYKYYGYGQDSQAA